jgi:tetratricopeptide (TPR) repeat protein
MRSGFAAVAIVLVTAPCRASGMDDYNQIAEVYRAHDFAQVVALSTQALATAPPDDALRGGFHHLRGAAEMNLQRWPEAVADLDQSLAALEGSDDLKVKFADVVTGLYWERGLAKAHATGCGDALADYNASLARDPKNAQVLTDRGVCYDVLGRQEDARADAAAALMLDPGNEDAQHLRDRLK